MKEDRGTEIQRNEEKRDRETYKYREKSQVDKSTRIETKEEAKIE